MPYEFITKNGLISQGNVTVTGSLITSQNVTASNISASGTGSFGIVGIGTVNPAYKLDVNGNANFTNGFYTNTDASSTSVFNRIDTVRTNNWLYIDNNYGHSVVGVYSSYRYQGVFAMGDSYKLPADGTTTGSLYGMAWSHPNAGGAAGNLTDHGLLIINNGVFKCAISNSIVASGNITAYSDERLKTNWRNMPKDYVNRLAQVKVGIYDRTDQENVTQVGVSAQSFQNLLPEAIMTAKDDMQTLSVNYGGAALASAVELAKEVVNLKELSTKQQTQIEDQKTEISELKSMINMLVDKVNKLID
jgi:predicted RNA-binding protein with PIN domain